MEFSTDKMCPSLCQFINKGDKSMLKRHHNIERKVRDLQPPVAGERRGEESGLLKLQTNSENRKEEERKDLK